ncbi:hypothetical protein [Albibacillus kandeliae]|uniref:hypothetical protein n=1 Tax=Albibacillus kandeliae TaxID=2174228 RepID=UPI0013003222|nr:hypothetical protein [Albibacillus kandeliae]
MKRMLGTGLLLVISATILLFSLWPASNGIRHYTDAELAGLTCAELSEKHEEVITAYHDASIAYFRRTGAFEDGLGLPEEADLPMIKVMTRIIRENGLAGVDLTKPFFHSSSAAASKQLSAVFSEFSALCASYPDMDAAAAGLRAAETLGLTQPLAIPD